MSTETTTRQIPVELGAVPDLFSPDLTDWRNWNLQLRTPGHLFPWLEARGVLPQDIEEVSRYRSNRTGWRVLTFKVRELETLRILAASCQESEFPQLRANLQLLLRATLTQKGTLRSKPQPITEVFYPQSPLPDRSVIKRQKPADDEQSAA